jgi:hypothetical protein
MPEANSVGQLEMRALSAELMTHLANPTTKLSRPAEVELGSCRWP